MPTFKGKNGFLALGGILTGAPQLNGALAQSATQMDLDAGGGALTGVVAVGDTFTIAGESGSPVHTVTAAGNGDPFYVAAGNQVNDINFTPAIAVGGVADNAAVTFVSNSVVQARLWGLNVEAEVLDVTRFGNAWEQKDIDVVRWTGRGEALLDYGDARQAELIDALAGNDAPARLDAVLFGIASGKFWYAQAALSNFGVSHQPRQAAVLTFAFEGHGAEAPSWN